MREIIHIRCEEWDIGNDLGKERDCSCGEQESRGIFKIMESQRNNWREKEWLVVERGKDLVKATEYKKNYSEGMEEWMHDVLFAKEPCKSGIIVFAGGSKEGVENDSKIRKTLQILT